MKAHMYGTHTGRLSNVVSFLTSFWGDHFYMQSLTLITDLRVVVMVSKSLSFRKGYQE